MSKTWRSDAPKKCFTEKIDEAKVLRSLRNPESKYRVLTFSVGEGNLVHPIDLGVVGLTLKRDYEGRWEVYINGLHYLADSYFVNVVNNKENAGISVEVYIDTNNYLRSKLWEYVNETDHLYDGLTIAEYLDLDIDLSRRERNPY